MTILYTSQAYDGISKLELQVPIFDIIKSFFVK